MVVKCFHCKKSFKKKYKSQKFCSLVCANRFNLNGLKRINLPKQNKDLAEFIGIMLGDGYVGKYFSRIFLNSVADKDYVNYVTQLARKLFGQKAVAIRPEKHQNLINIQISSRIVSDFLRGFGLIPYCKTIP